MKVNIQDAFMNHLRKTRTSVTIFTVNGVMIKGVISSFDTFTVIVSSDKGQQMIFKHAISTIVPATPVDLKQIAMEENNKNNEE